MQERQAAGQRQLLWRRRLLRPNRMLHILWFAPAARCLAARLPNFRCGTAAPGIQSPTCVPVWLLITGSFQPA